jgi:cytochrome c-type biogenesis protein
MDDMGMAFGSALWLGFLTSISPCPLATNVAAMSFISRGVGSPRRVLLTGLVYTAGRSLAYLVLGILMVASLLTAPGVSLILQERMNQILGPALILAGVFLLDLIRLPSRGGGIGSGLQGRAERWGVWGGGLLGLVFALSFCPTSAALFFGSLIPLALRSGSSVILPSVYGIGTAIPVFAFAIALAIGVNAVGRMFNVLTRFEVWARRITGVIFVLVGGYYCLTYIFEVFV